MPDPALASYLFVKRNMHTIVGECFATQIFYAAAPLSCPRSKSQGQPSAERVPGVELEASQYYYVSIVPCTLVDRSHNLTAALVTCKNVDESTAGCIVARVALNEGNRSAELSRSDIWCGNDSVNTNIVRGTQIEADKLLHG